MYVLLAASVVALAIALERSWSLQTHRIVPMRFAQVVRQMLEARQWEEARLLCGNNDSALAAIIGAGLRFRHSGRAVIREVMQDRGRREAARLERYVGALAAIVTVAPLLGLLGTVLGMIETFQAVTATAGAGGTVAAGALASGIWEALLTTAAGLILAVPAFIAHRLILSRVDGLVGLLEEVGLDMAELMAESADTTAVAPEGRSAGVLSTAGDPT